LENIAILTSYFTDDERQNKQKPAS